MSFSSNIKVAWLGSCVVLFVFTNTTKQNRIKVVTEKLCYTVAVAILEFWILMVSLFCYLLLNLSRFLVNSYRFLSEILKKSHVHRPWSGKLTHLHFPLIFNFQSPTFPASTLSYYRLRYFRKIRAFFGCSAYSMKSRHMPQLPVRLLYTGNFSTH